VSTNSEDCQDMFPFMVYRLYKKEISRIYEWVKISCLHHPYKNFGNNHCIRQLFTGMVRVYSNCSCERRLGENIISVLFIDIFGGMMTPNQHSNVLTLGQVFVKSVTLDGSSDCIGLRVVPARLQLMKIFRY